MITDLLTSAAGGDFDLADALDPSNDIGVKDKNKGGRTSRRIRVCSRHEFSFRVLSQRQGPGRPG